MGSRPIGNGRPVAGSGGVGESLVPGHEIPWQAGRMPERSASIATSATARNIKARLVLVFVLAKFDG